MWVKQWDTSHIPNRELARTSFPVESTNNINIKITHHINVGCIYEGISLMNTCYSVSVMFNFI